MKILHVLYSGMGGHGNVFFSMVKADTSGSFQYEALFNGIEDIRSEYIEKCSRLGITWNFVKKKPGLDIGFYKNLIAAIKKSDAEIIFLHGSTQVLWAKLAIVLGKQKRLLIVRETQANLLKTKQDWVWLKTAMLFAGKIIFLSENYKQEIKKKLSFLYRENKIEVIPNGIDLEKFKPVLKINKNKIVLGMQSRLVKIKDHITLLQAFALVSARNSHANYMLKIAGDGEYRTTLEGCARGLNITQNVEFTGMLNEDDLVDFIQSLDIYIHASLGETMSTAIMQAMACEVPIIASDVDGISNMIENGKTGILVPVKNKNKLAEEMERLVNDTKLQYTLGKNALQYAKEHFSNQEMFNKYKALF